MRAVKVSFYLLYIQKMNVRLAGLQWPLGDTYGRGGSLVCEALIADHLAPLDVDLLHAGGHLAGGLVVGNRAGVEQLVLACLVWPGWPGLRC